MFKFAHAFLLSALLGSTLTAAYNDSLAEYDVNSDAEAFQEDLIEDGDSSIGEQLKRSSASDAAAGCPPGFKYLALAQSCYMVVYESHDWYSASARCQQIQRGAHLIAINSHAENNDVVKFLSEEKPSHPACIPRQHDHKGGFFWTAGQRRKSNKCNFNPYVWKLSDSRQLPLTFTWWLPREPNCFLRREHCLLLWPMKGFGWNDERCSLNVCPLCEFTPR